MVTLILPHAYQPPIALTVLPRGLTIHSFILQFDGRTHDIVIGPQNAADFTNPAHKYQNVIVGRYSNRVPVDTFNLEKAGAKSTFTPKSNEHPNVSLHGGVAGFDVAEWEVIKPEATTLFTTAEKGHISAMPAESATIFRYISPDGEEGFPGKLLNEVLFALIPAGKPETAQPAPGTELALGSLIIVYRAKVFPTEDGSKVVTPVNLTQHWGFNLDASLLSEKRQPMTDVKDHVLTINADHHIELDELALSTGNLLPTANTPEHVHSAKPIGENFSPKGYDSFYVFRKPSNSPIHVSPDKFKDLDVLKDLTKPFTLDTAEAKTPLVELASKKAGIRILFESNQPGVQFYSGNFMNGAGARKRIHGGTGSLEGNDGYTAASAAFLEFHEHLAAWMHPSATPESDTLLVSGDIYNNFVKVSVAATFPDA